LANPQQGFYDPVKERFTEPAHTGISYSFTDNGYYETSYYRALSNRMSSEEFPSSTAALMSGVATNPGCVKGMMQWQHGTFQKLDNGSLVLTPISVDGRQLMSDPCNYHQAIYSRYNQSELIQVGVSAI
jgi:Chaperone for protein-folding within the ER, fungal